MKKLLLSLLIFLTFNLHAQDDDGPTLEQCVTWLNQNIDVKYKLGSNTHSTSLEKSVADNPDFVLIKGTISAKCGSQVKEYQFRLSNIEYYNINLVYYKRAKVYQIILKGFSKNGNPSVDFKHTVSGCFVIPSENMSSYHNIKNGSKSSVESVLGHGKKNEGGILLKNVSSEAEGRDWERKFNKVFSRIVELTEDESGAKSINDDFFDKD